MARPIDPSLVPRLVSALVLAPLALAAAVVGGAVFALVLAVFGVAVAFEWSRMVTRGAGRGLFGLLMLTAVLTVAAGLLVGPWAQFLVLVAAFLVAAAAAKRLGAGRDWAVAGVAYVGLPILALSVLRASPQYGADAVIWLFAVIWAGDAAAFAAGRLIGGPRLAPAISPAKTWAGALGALAGAAAVGWVAALVIGDTAPVLLAAFSLALGAVALAGDLGESALKRRFGRKDSGALIPGHGGAMDRLDSLIAASIVAAAVGGLRGGVDGGAEGAILW